MRLLLVLLLAVPVFAQNREADWRSDITYLKTELPRRHPNLFFQLLRAEWERGLDEVANDVPFLSDDEVRIRLQQVVTRVGMRTRRSTSGRPC